MSDSKERRQTERRLAGETGLVSFGQDPLPCRVIDVSDTGAQVRIEGRRSTRNFVGKRASLIRHQPSGDVGPLEGRIVWARPAVNGVYLGIELSHDGNRDQSRAAND